MPRTRSKSSLPPMRRPRGDVVVELQAEHLLKMVRRAALRHQGEEARLFYTLRDVAARFHAPVSMVATTYRKLEEEGLLTRVRGSKTILHARAHGRRNLSVPAAIAIPMSLTIFVMSQKSRLFYLAVINELRRHGFAASGILFDKKEARGELLLEKIKHSQAEVALCYMPSRLIGATVDALRDAGISTLGICDGGLPAISCRYQIDRDAAIRKVMADWSKDKRITHVRVLRTIRRATAEEEEIATFFEEAHLPYKFINTPQRELASFLDSLAAAKGAAVFLHGEAAAYLALREAELFLRLTKARRVALIDGPVSSPLADLSGAEVDLIMAEWTTVAHEITRDLKTKEALSSAKRMVFPARAHLRARLGNFAQSL